MNKNTERQFNNLKIHTQYSICEGALRTADLAKYCKEKKIKFLLLVLAIHLTFVAF